MNVQDLLQVAYAGRKIRFDLTWNETQPGLTALAAGTTVTTQFTVSNDSDFIWQALTYQCNIGNAALEVATDIVPLVNINMTDTTAGRLIGNDAAPLSSLGGNGREPFYLPIPRLMAAKTVWQVTMTNLTSGTDYNIYLTFIGMKVFDLGPAEQQFAAQNMAQVIPPGVVNR